jgi:Mrp family chromosome partitioning ATPase
MTVLDQAFIKAYAKDQPAQPTVAADAEGARGQAAGRTARARPAQTIDQIYHDGALYRLEVPRASENKGISAPHLHLPPTSPRRSVRRSLLKLLSAQNGPSPSTLPAPEAPRVARKVIIRHIAHSSPTAPAALLRGTTAGRVGATPQAELPPETLHEDDSAAPPAPGFPLPPAAPHVAPLNQALLHSPQLLVVEQWNGFAAQPSMIVQTDTRVVIRATATGRLDKEIELPPAIEQRIQVRVTGKIAETEIATPVFSGKSIDDADSAGAKIAIDAAHAMSSRKPHARFAPEATAEKLDVPPVTAVQPATDLPAAQSPAKESIQADIGLAQEEMTALASDLLPHAGPFAFGKAAPTPETHRGEKLTVPVWEVDRFHLPKTCEKLLADQDSYFATAGEKLVAAARDGLRVLAVSGSRRGEGRTTLALCLAHTAAKAGIQVALMDCDFARPQLASKIGLEVAFGWQDAAIGKISLSEAAVKSVADGMTALPLESTLESRSLSLADPRVTATIRAAAATFDLLILDMGPIGSSAELAFPVGEKCPLDAAIVIRDLRFATALEAETIGHHFQDAGVEAVGIAENFVNEEI